MYVFFIGLFIGAIVGFAICAILIMGKKAEYK